MRLVSPSRRRMVPVTLRVRNVGSLPLLPTSAESPSRLNSAVNSSVMSPAALTLGVTFRVTPTFRYWKEVAGANVDPPVFTVLKVVTGTGTSWPILSSVFLPSAARSLGAARIRVVASDCRNFAKIVEGMLTRKSARLIEESMCARTVVMSPGSLVWGANLTDAS